MKKILLACAAMAALLVSCSKGNDELIVGKWQKASEKFILYYDDGSDPLVETSDTTTGGWVFNADGTGHSYSLADGRESVAAQLTYTVTDDSIFVSYSQSLVSICWKIETLNKRELRVSRRGITLIDPDGDKIGTVDMFLYLLRK